MFLKRKGSGNVKGRGCADGRKQRMWTWPKDASSPTAARESVFLTAVVDAKEGQDVGVSDLPGAFMQTDMDDKIVHVVFQGAMAELLVELAPEVYGQYLTTKKGQPTIYVQLLKALYGTLRAARLFYEKLSGHLMEWGFVLNPYNACVANKIINGKQCTVVWHVDDLKISHVDPDVMSDIIGKLELEFGKEAPITKFCGKKLEYLGMLLDFEVPGQVTVDMRSYIKAMIDKLPAKMRGSSATPAASCLFDTRETAPKLGDKERDFFHRSAAQLLYLSQHGRPDIRTAAAFLTTRVKNPDKDDKKNWVRL